MQNIDNNDLKRLSHQSRTQENYNSYRAISAIATLLGALFVIRYYLRIAKGIELPEQQLYLLSFLLVTLSSAAFFLLLPTLYKRLDYLKLDLFILIYTASIYIALLCIGVLDSAEMADFTAYSFGTLSAAFIYRTDIQRFIAFVVLGFVFFNVFHLLILGRLMTADSMLIPLALGILSIYISFSREKMRHEIFRLSQELFQKNRLLKADSLSDPLTGLYNRRYMSESLKKLIGGFDRIQIPFSILLCDIDHFKSLNDDFGHSVGDQTLQHFAKILSANCRVYDSAVRYGGEEFLLILQGIDLQLAILVAERIRNDVENYGFPNLDRPLTASFGLAQFQPGDTEASLIERADACLYRAKQDGRNLVRS